MPTLVGTKQLFPPSLPSLAEPFPSFDRKWTDLIRQRWISKCLFPHRHFVYSVKTCIIQRWKKIENFLIWKNEIKYLKWKNENKKYSIYDLSTKIHLLIILMLISSSVKVCVFHSFRVEEKLVALLVYSSFVRE